MMFVKFQIYSFNTQARKTYLLNYKVFMGTFVANYPTIKNKIQKQNGEF